MPWRETGPVEERLKFIMEYERRWELLEGHVNVSALCREYGVSRKTGYKWIARYVPGQPSSLEDHSRAVKCRTMCGARTSRVGFGSSEASATRSPSVMLIAGSSSGAQVFVIRGIVPERIEPGHPEQNGRHERMHRTLKDHTANPPRGDSRAQQRCFDEAAYHDGMWRAGAAVLVSLAGMGCSAESEDAPPADTCAPPKRIVGERCLEPGVQDDGCPAGTLAVGDGSCQPAGVPPELCAEGFVHDGDAGCEPVLPPAPCDKGQMAIAGESACHPVMACGSGTWGDIPIDQATVHVDNTYAGGDSDGSLLRPWTSITSAVAAAPPGALIAIAAGSYVEDVDVDKPVRLWGVCPAEVELAGTADGSAALSFRPCSSGSEVRGLAITGVQLGVLVAGSADIVLEQLWIHDTLSRTVNVQSTADLTSVTLRSSLIEENHDIGVIVFGSEATLEGVVVRDTLPRARDQEAGRGIVSAISDSGSRSTAHIKSSLVQRNHDLGVFVAASDATLEGLIVRGTLPRASDGGFRRRRGRGRWRPAGHAAFGERGRHEQPHRRQRACRRRKLRRPRRPRHERALVQRLRSGRRNVFRGAL
ncbi:MAG TPA: integrase core domain-containing protein [Polyangiaceae bacterium]|nr:integrase core domain-containing protein [Polyangiaceae bacterium]